MDADADTDGVENTTDPGGAKEVLRIHIGLSMGREAVDEGRGRGTGNQGKLILKRKAAATTKAEVCFTVYGTGI